MNPNLTIANSYIYIKAKENIHKDYTDQIFDDSCFINSHLVWEKYTQTEMKEK